MPPHWLATVPLQELDYNLGEENGWPEPAKTVAGVLGGLSPAEQASTAIVAGNHGEAGAIDRYGPALGLPPAHSGHNNYWWWGPPPADATTAVLIGWPESDMLAPYFDEVEQVAILQNAAGVDNDEDGLPVWLCRGPKRPWADVWTEFRHCN